jgi:lysophospholipid acyltransferase (LPLAT)-like uncharacterized protein
VSATAQPVGAPRPGVRAVVALGGTVIDSLLRTTRQRVAVGEEVLASWLVPRRPAVYLIWHGRLLPGSYANRQRGLATLISHHRDGDYIAGVVERWGYRIVRGSSSRGGGAALRQIVRLLRQGTPVAVTPDGPRGPRQEMKVGPLLAAQLAEVPLIPCAAGVDRAWAFGGWDRFLVPKPFSTIRMGYGQPIAVPAGLAGDEMERLRLVVEARMNELIRRVDEG